MAGTLQSDDQILKNSTAGVFRALTCVSNLVLQSLVHSLHIHVLWIALIIGLNMGLCSDQLHNPLPQTKAYYLNLPVCVKDRFTVGTADERSSGVVSPLRITFRVLLYLIFRNKLRCFCKHGFMLPWWWYGRELNLLGMYVKTENCNILKRFLNSNKLGLGDFFKLPNIPVRRR